VFASLTQGAAGVIDVKVAGATPATEFGQITVQGAATLAGKLRARTTGGYVPAAGTSHAVLTYAGRTGTFATFDLPSGWTAAVGPTSTALSGPSARTRS
jgi:hypothetical protein